MGFLFARCLHNEEKNKFLDIFGEKQEKNEELGLKIYICGNLPQKDKIMKDLFKKNISDKRYSSRATHEFKTDQFYWIAKEYSNLSTNIFKSICEEIQNDTDSKEENKKSIEQNIIMYFGNENINKLFEEIMNIGSVYYPFVIIISNNIINIEDIEFSEKRKIINIVLNEKVEERLNSIIISQLWECDCYYNEKGNVICRYTPDNIFKTFYSNLSFYSINILLTGNSRAGKSTFINFLSNKLCALESCKKTSTSQKITQYCLYLNNDGLDHSFIKLFDTPGILSESNKLNECKTFLNNILENKENNIENIIHFILFFFKEGDSLEGIDEIFDLLDKCNKPVLFIINKAMDESDNGKTKDIASTISFLKRKNFNNLIDKKNYFGINIVKTSKINVFGVENIFKRMNKIFKEKNQFNEDINQIIEKLIKNYKNMYEKPLEKQNREEELKKLEIEINELKNKLDQNSEMFKNIDISSIINTGTKSVIRCNNLINSLGDMSKVFESINKIIPAISFFQAFMIKEIGEIYGFNLNEMNKEVSNYFTNIEANIKNLDLMKYSHMKHLKGKKIKINNEIIEKQLKSELENPNKKFIIKLAEIFFDLRETEIKNNQFSTNIIDRILTNGICIECQDYLVNELKNSFGLIFWKNYLIVCSKLEKGLENFSKLNSEKDWGKKEMKIIHI